MKSSTGWISNVLLLVVAVFLILSFHQVEAGPQKRQCQQPGEECSGPKQGNCCWLSSYSNGHRQSWCVQGKCQLTPVQLKVVNNKVEWELLHDQSNVSADQFEDKDAGQMILDTVNDLLEKW